MQLTAELARTSGEVQRTAVWMCPRLDHRLRSLAQCLSIFNGVDSPETLRLTANPGSNPGFGECFRKEGVAMDTWILKMIRVVSLRRVLAWGASLVCGVLLATSDGRYMRNFLR